jgi:hypothetical protein
MQAVRIRRRWRRHCPDRPCRAVSGHCLRDVMSTVREIPARLPDPAELRIHSDDVHTLTYRAARALPRPTDEIAGVAA